MDFKRANGHQRIKVGTEGRNFSYFSLLLEDSFTFPLSPRCLSKFIWLLLLVGSAEVSLCSWIRFFWFFWFLNPLNSEFLLNFFPVAEPLERWHRIVSHPLRDEIGNFLPFPCFASTLQRRISFQSRKNRGKKSIFFPTRVLWHIQN